MEKLTIQTADGSARAFYFTPSGSGPWPGVLMYMDGIGIRPAVLSVAERLSSYGFAVLLPDLFYRSGRYRPMNAKTIFATPQSRAKLFTKFFGPASPAHVMKDSKAYIKTLKGLPGVAKGPIATTGYCLGGKMSLVAAGTFGAKIALAASFHGGGLATEDRLSPHRLAPKMSAFIYVGGAIEDASFTDADKRTLKASLKAHHVPHRIETYPAKHGWVMPDHLAYDATMAEKHWRVLPKLLHRVLG